MILVREIFLVAATAEVEWCRFGENTIYRVRTGRVWNASSTC